MKFLRKKLPHLPTDRVRKIVMNRYFWVTALAFVYILFFDTFDLRSQWKMQSKINQLEQQKQTYQDAITELRDTYKKLENDPSELEKVAREQYLMKRNNEDLYIIVPETKP